MNEPVCRAAQYLPSYTAAPTLNSTPRLSLTLTLLLQTPCTLNYRGAARHTNRLRSPFCTKTTASTVKTSTAHQQQVHNKSFKWSVGFNVRRIEWHQTALMPSGVYNFQGHASFTDVLDGTARRERRFGASPTPTPTPPARLSLSE